MNTGGSSVAAWPQESARQPPRCLTLRSPTQCDAARRACGAASAREALR